MGAWGALIGDFEADGAAGKAKLADQALGSGLLRVIHADRHLRLSGHATHVALEAELLDVGAAPLEDVIRDHRVVADAAGEHVLLGRGRGELDVGVAHLVHPMSMVSGD